MRMIYLTGMRLTLIYIFLVILGSSCKKDPFPVNSGYYFQMRIDGKATTFAECGLWSGGGQFDCTKGYDNSLTIYAGCGDIAFLYLRRHSEDGTYLLSDSNNAGFWRYPKQFITNARDTGYLTIKKVMFGNIPSMQGTFQYNARDTSGTIVRVTEGSFLMELY